jgi:hypothetical protein
VHRTVQCSNPARAAAMCRTSVRDRHLGQRGRAAARGETVWACVSVKTHPCGIKREHTRTLYIAMDADGRPVITELCGLDGANGWSILLTFGNLMERLRASAARSVFEGEEE